MGVVYQAHDLSLDRRVALKFIAPEIGRDAEAKERFLREARAAGAIDHPNICTIHEIAEAEGDRLFIVMPAYAGETLRSRLSRGPLTEGEAIGIGEQVARAVGAAHEHGIVHGDITPTNIFVTKGDRVKPLDFGLTRASDAAAPHPTKLRGTVPYLSPEQIRGDAPIERSDVWAVGVIAFEMLTGHRPFSAGDRFENGRALALALAACRPAVPVSAATIAPLAGRRVRRSAAALAGLTAVGVIGWVFWPTVRGPDGTGLPAAQGAVTHLVWADDNPENNAAVILRLRESGVRVTTTLSTAETLGLYDPSLHQLVVSDIGRYEGENGTYVESAGLELLAALKERSDGVQLVFCTSHRAAAVYRDRALAAGALGIVSNCEEVLTLTGL